MARFYTEDNLKLLVNISQKYMQDKYAFAVDDEKALKQLTYDVMTDIEKECKERNVPVEKKNIAVLNNVKEVYVKRRRLVPVVKKPNIQSLARDSETFGNRPVNIANIAYAAAADPYQHKALETDITRIIESRDDDVGIGRKPVPGPALAATKELAEDNDAFMRRFKEFEVSRGDLERTFEAQQQIHRNDPPASATITATATAKTVPHTTMHIGIDSRDRAWQTGAEPHPCSYVAAFSGGYKNISEIRVGKVVLPEAAMSSSYLVLKIDEFAGMYDGTNEVLRKAFCRLIYDSAYVAGNRRYVVLKPDRSVAGVFASLALSSISVCLLKPDGKLVSPCGGEAARVLGVLYENSMLKVLTNGGNYQQGDVVLVRNYVLKSSAHPEDNVKAFNEFANRAEGHEVVGDASVGSFCINAPLQLCLKDYSSDVTVCGVALNLSLQNSIGVSMVVDNGTATLGAS